MLWFLRLFRQFRELDALVLSQAERIEACAKDQERISELLVENESLNTDLENLREANQELSSEKSLLEDRLSSAIADKDKLWETMQTALQGERFAYQTMVNHSVQKTGGGIPYPDAHSLPAQSVHKPQEPGPIGRSARVLPSEIAERSTRKFVQEYVENIGKLA